MPNTRFLLNCPLAGWNSKFALIVRPYDSSEIMCQEKLPDHPFEDECDDLVHTMPASIEEKDTFGPEGAPGVTAPVPFIHETYCKILGFSRYRQNRLNSNL